MSKIRLFPKRRSDVPAVPRAPRVELPDSSPKELLTLREAIAFAKVSDPTIRRWIRTGVLRAYRAGRQVRIDKADLVRFLCRSIHP